MPKLTDKQTEKYSRQIIIEKIGMSGQKKIFNSSICIIGCGGLGSSAAQYLSMTGVGNIMLIDHDMINLSNLNRQTLFFEKDIGKYKVDTLKRSPLLELNLRTFQGYEIHNQSWELENRDKSLSLLHYQNQNNYHKNHRCSYQ